MKYLVTAQPGTTPVPPEQELALWQAEKEWFNARLADGTVECNYFFLDEGGFAICNVDSHEALWDLLVTYPFYDFSIWKVRALCDWAHASDNIIESLQS
jgi:muconolactone delta-isomerase